MARNEFLVPAYIPCFQHAQRMHGTTVKRTDGPSKQLDVIAVE